MVLSCCPIGVTNGHCSLPSSVEKHLSDPGDCLQPTSRQSHKDNYHLMTRVPHKSSSPASPARMVRQMLRTVVACRESRTCIPLHFLLSDLWLARRNFTFTQKHQMLFKAVPAATQRNSAKVPVVLRLLSCLGERAAGSNNLHLDFSFIC